MSDTDSRARNYRAIRRKMEALELDLRRDANGQTVDSRWVAAHHVEYVGSPADDIAPLPPRADATLPKLPS